MPDGQTVTKQLTLVQIEFVVKFLKVVPERHWFTTATGELEIQRVESDNEKIKRQYLEYLRARDSALQLFTQMDTACTQAGDAYRVSADADPLNHSAVFEQQFKGYRDGLDLLGSSLRQVIEKVDTAPEDKPFFEEGQRTLVALRRTLDSHLDGMPDPPDPVVRTVVGTLQSYLPRVAEMRSLDATPGLSRATADKALDDPGDEAKRQGAVKNHDQACDDAAASIRELIAEAQRPSDRSDAQLKDDAEIIVARLAEARAPFVSLLRGFALAEAGETLKSLATDASGLGGIGGIAQREQFRMDEIKTRKGTLDAAIGKLATRVDTLQVEMSRAEGFNEKREKAATYQAEKDRLDGLRARKLQYALYETSLADRVERLDGAKDACNQAIDLAKDPSGFLAARQPLPAVDASAKLMLLGGKTDGGFFIGQIDALRKQYSHEAQRVSVQDQLFLGETDMPNLSPEQLSALFQVLGQAQVQGEAGNLAEAQVLVEEAQRLYTVFLNCSKFALPDMPEAPPSPADRTARDIKRLQVQLDRFWGRGGDGDNAMRDALDQIARDRGVALGNAPIKLGPVEQALADFASRLTAAEKSFVPAPQDKAARDRTRRTSKEIKTSLLGLFETRPLQEAEIRDVPARRLLVIEEPDGSRSFHEIATDKDGTEARRKNTHVPLAAMEKLLQTANMLDTLAQIEAPGAADALDENARKAEAEMQAIVNGGEDYDHVKATIDKITVLMGDKAFVGWGPSGLGDAKAKFEDFKKTYVTRMLPGDAKTRVDTFHTTFGTLRDDATKLKTDHDAVDTRLAQIRADLENGGKAAKDALGKTVATKVKDGPDKLIRGLNRDQLDDAQTREVADLVAALRQNLTYLKSKQDDHKGVEGKLNDRLRLARQTLGSKTTAGIADARRLAREIERDMATEQQKIDQIDLAANGLADLRQLCAVLAASAAGVRENEQLKTDAEAVRKTFRDTLDKVGKHLGKYRSVMVNHTEYKAIFDSLETQYDTITKTYAKDRDADHALSQYRLQSKSAEQLLGELQGSVNVQKTGKTVQTDFIPQFGAAILQGVQDVQQAATTLSGTIRSRAQEDDDQKADAGLQDKVQKVIDVLGLVSRAEVTGLAKLKDSLKPAVDAALQLPPGDVARAPAIAKAREAALANVRDIRKRLEAEPSLKTYRDNPFDHGQSWARCMVAMHALERRLIKDLDPSKA